VDQPAAGDSGVGADIVMESVTLEILTMDCSRKPWAKGSVIRVDNVDNPLSRVQSF